MNFSEDVKSKYSRFKEDMIQIESGILEHEKRYIHAIDQSNLCIKPLGNTVLNFLQMCLYRSRMLIEGCINSVNVNNPLLAYLSVRAHFEVTGLVAYYLRKQRDYYNSKITYDDFYQNIDRLLFGGRVRALKDLKAPDPINVLNLIDTADLMTKEYLKDKRPYFRDVYDFLSEYCHPNYLGINMAQGDNPVNVFLKETTLSDNDVSKILHLNVSILSFFLFYDEILNDLFLKGELSPEYHPAIMDKANFG